MEMECTTFLEFHPLVSKNLYSLAALVKISR